MVSIVAGHREAINLRSAERSVDAPLKETCVLELGARSLRIRSEAFI